MGLPYLKIEPIKAIQILDKCIITGYQIKDKITHEYYADKIQAEAKINEWQKKAIKWVNETIQELGKVFVSEKELYNFRDAPISPLVKTDTNIKWNNIINLIDAHIKKLNEYDYYIRTQFDVKIEVIGRDKIIQNGDNNELLISND